MEDRLAQLLAHTQLAEQAPRQQAEIELKHARTDPAFPTSLASIASHTGIDTSIRQAALSLLRQFLEQNWADDGQDDQPTIPISEETREALRRSLLELSLSPEEDRKVKISASYVVGKIALHDFPEQWPSLLPTVLNVIPGGTDAQLHGALSVLGDIIEESLSEDQFFTMADHIVKIVSDVALNENRKPTLRAMAISVFRGCFDLMDILKDEHKKEIKAFGERLIAEWLPFFLRALQARLPDLDATNGQPAEWNSLIALKVQVVKTLIKIKAVFADLLLPQSTSLFQAVWEELSSIKDAFRTLYVDNDAQSRLEDADGLPYTLDFLILEEIDFLKMCFRAPPVKAELEAQLAAHGGSARDTPWMSEMMMMLVAYSCVTRDEEGMWAIDASLYLAEETSVSANYTARTASGDLLIKLGEWFDQNTVDSLFHLTQGFFSGGQDDWRSQESAMYLFNMLLGDFYDLDKKINEGIAEAYLGLVAFAIKHDQQPLLQARGYLVGGALARMFSTPQTLLDRAIAVICEPEDPDVEVVRVAAIKSFDGFVSNGQVDHSRQVPMLLAISKFLNSQDQSELATADELLVTLAEALRAVICLNVAVVLSDEAPSMALLFTVTNLGASNFQVVLVIDEAFQEIVRGLSDPPSYAALCGKALPSLTSALDSADLASDDPVVTSVTELLAYLIQDGPEPLPTGFVAETLPRLDRLLMESMEGEVLRPAAECIKYLLAHDHQQVFSWHDKDGRSGLERCLHIIDRLLGAAVTDDAASEVGGVAAELVAKAGQQRLGPFLPQLLQAVASRLVAATKTPLIQSLTLVFAGLSMTGAQDVIEFLSAIQIAGQQGLELVLAKWLENSIEFSGYDAIRQNVIALSKVYSLNNARVAQTMVKGDQIVPESNRIMTRSRARLCPITFTSVPAPLKILKVLIEELKSAAGTSSAPLVGAAAAAAAAADDDDGDEDGAWEDVDDTLDLSLGASKHDLLSSLTGTSRQRDQETYAYLCDFFVGAARENVAGFQNWFGMLTPEEQATLNELASAQN